MGANTAHEWSELDPEVQRAVLDIMAAQLRSIEDVLVEARRRKHLPANIDIPTLATYVLGTSRTLAMMHRSGTDIATIRGVADIALAAIPTRRA
jgi:hypothetical protein